MFQYIITGIFGIAAGVSRTKCPVSIKSLPFEKMNYNVGNVCSLHKYSDAPVNVWLRFDVQLHYNYITLQSVTTAGGILPTGPSDTDEPIYVLFCFDIVLIEQNTIVLICNSSSLNYIDNLNTPTDNKLLIDMFKLKK